MAFGLGIGGAAIGSSGAGAVIDSAFFELDSNGDLQPRAVVIDFNDAWDLVSDEITPAATPAAASYFDIDGNGDLQPIA